MILKKQLSLLICLILWINPLLSAVVAGTLIKTLANHTAIENIVVGEKLAAYDTAKSITTATVTHITPTTADTIIAVTTRKGTFHTSPDQQFFDPNIEKWIIAEDITTDTFFLDAQLNFCPCLHVESIHSKPITTYRITTTKPHTFFITEQELLAHNAFPIVIGLAWLFGGGLEFAGATIGTALLGSYVGVQLYNAQKQKAQNCNVEFHVIPCGSPCPDPDDENIFESIKLKSDKKMRHKRFCNFYRDPDTKLWWSKDKANHGGSAFKVFKETAKGLEWTFDADEIGHQIISKHKGPIGLFISYKELIKCP